jgi:hypothetical protein
LATSITISVPDAAVPRILEAFKADQGWTPESTIPEGQLVKSAILKYVRAIVVGYESRLAAEVAAEAARAAIP